MRLYGGSDYSLYILAACVSRWWPGYVLNVHGQSKVKNVVASSRGANLMELCKTDTQADNAALQVETPQNA